MLQQNKLLFVLMTAVMLSNQPLRADTNPLVNLYFWQKMKETENWRNIVQAHIDSGENIKEIHASRGTALHIVVRVGFFEAIPMLLNHGLDVNADKNEFGKFNTPLHSAVLFANDHDEQEIKAISIKMIRILLENGANIDARNQNGNTSLHLAFGYGAVETVNFLIGSGANQMILNDYLDTPFEYSQTVRGRKLSGNFYYDNKNRYTKKLRWFSTRRKNGRITLTELAKY